MHISSNAKANPRNCMCLDISRAPFMSPSRYIASHIMMTQFESNVIHSNENENESMGTRTALTPETDS